MNMEILMRNRGSNLKISLEKGVNRLMRDYYLIGLRVIGPKFAWFSGRLQRLDRVTSCVDWKEWFSKAMVQNLLRTTSDLHSTLISMNQKDRVNYRRKPFHFEMACCLHEKLQSFIKT